MFHPSRSVPRRALLLGLGIIPILVVGLSLVAGVWVLPSRQAEATPPTSSGILVFPSAEPVAPGSTPGPAPVIPLVRPEFPYLGEAFWEIHHPSDARHLIEGFASAPSYLPGQELRLAVSTSAASYRVTIFRVSGRAPAESPFEQVGQIPRQTGQRQPAPEVDPVTRMVSAPWAYTTSFTIPPEWPSGIYLARLESDEDVQSYVPFVVRSARPTRFLLVSSALNWQAYNEWGGSDLYMTKVGQPLAGVTRALAVSFDRPYAFDDGAGQLFRMELPLVAWFERQGLDVSFTTDYDLSVNPDAQPLPKAVIFNGHSEYWGVPLRLWLERHVLQQGDLNLAVFGADTGYWPVSLSHAGSEGPRVVTCYKNGPLPASTGLAPTMGATSSPAVSPEPSDTAEASDSQGTSHGPEDETKGGAVIPSFPASGPYNGPYVGAFAVQALLGVSYQHITTAMADYSLMNPVPIPSLLAGTGIEPGSALGFFVGGEVDAVDRRPGVWDPIGNANDHVIAGAYQIPSRHGEKSAAEAVYRALPDGARVFASGTFYWGWALDPGFAKAHAVTPGMGRLTRNLLDLLAGG